jgi:hypothetical protein
MKRKKGVLVLSSFTKEGKLLTILSGFSISYSDPEIVWVFNQVREEVLPVEAKI